MAQHPYSSLPDRSIWRTAIAETNPLEWRDVYRKRFDISPSARISSAGSCFAQHIGRRVRDAAFNYQDFEPAPKGLPQRQHSEFGYGLFSARFGNIYTARQLVQLFQESFGEVAWTGSVWQREDRFYDPLRPTIEPDGFGSPDEVRTMRLKQHLPSVRKMLCETDVFVFTFGLTEAWVSVRDGTVYPVCPGVVAGEFDPAEHHFHNFSHAEILADMILFIERLRGLNPSVKFLFTVSPVPLTATASDEHVLSATVYSKSVLRAVAGELRARFDCVDYFPSYELIAASAARGMFFEPNQRNVSTAGVDHVMRYFFAEHTPGMTAAVADSEPTPSARELRMKEGLSVVCDEEKLDPVVS